MAPGAAVSGARRGARGAAKVARGAARKARGADKDALAAAAPQREVEYDSCSVSSRSSSGSAGARSSMARSAVIEVQHCYAGEESALLQADDVDEVIVIEAGSDDEEGYGSEFEARLRRRVVRHLREQERGALRPEGSDEAAAAAARARARAPAPAPAPRFRSRARSRSESPGHSRSRSRSRSQSRSRSETARSRRPPASAQSPKSAQSRKSGKAGNAGSRSRSRSRSSKAAAKLARQWDREWRALKGSTKEIVSFFVPPALLLALSAALSLVLLWPASLAVRGAALAQRVLFGLWHVLVLFAGTCARFPHHLVLRTLHFSEGLARGALGAAERVRGALGALSAMSWFGLARGAQVAFGALAGAGERVVRGVGKVVRGSRLAARGLLGSLAHGLSHVLYIGGLPLRVALRGLAIALHVALTALGSLGAIPKKLADFIINSPTAFGRTARRVVRAVRRHKQDILDVAIALLFMALVALLVSGLLWPLFVGALSQALHMLATLQSNIARLRLPSLRLPRVNLQRLRDVMPFWLPSLPLPDLKVVLYKLGLRDLSLAERLSHAFSA
jgi:hypothetical protein